jgi:hypothetical protein
MAGTRKWSASCDASCARFPRATPGTPAGYYMLAIDVWRLDELRWHAETSMLKTLGAP